MSSGRLRILLPVVAVRLWAFFVSTSSNRSHQTFRGAYIPALKGGYAPTDNVEMLTAQSLAEKGKRADRIPGED